MVPFSHNNDHVNCTKWRTVCVAEIKNLLVVVVEEFRQGNFVVKHSGRKFNQVGQDKTLELLNGTEEMGVGIGGITKSASVLSRWALSYNLRSHSVNSALF